MLPIPFRCSNVGKVWELKKKKKWLQPKGIPTFAMQLRKEGIPSKLVIFALSQHGCLMLMERLLLYARSSAQVLKFPQMLSTVVMLSI